MTDIVTYGTCAPCWQLQRTGVAKALGSGGGRGSRSVTGFDEDSTTGVEAARVALFAAYPEMAADVRLAVGVGPGIVSSAPHQPVA